jgi:hypothetical protein
MMINAGIGKTLALHHATLQLLQTRTWMDTAYLRLSDDDDDPSILLTRLLHCSIAATVPQDHVAQRLAYAVSGGHRCGLVIDNIRSATALERLVPWARSVRHHAPAIQVLFGVRADTGTAVPDGIRHVALLPLGDAIADALLERSILLHAHRRLSIVLPENAVVSSGSASSGSGPPTLGVVEHDTHSLSEAASPLLCAPAPPDLSTITQPALSLAREGLRLCRGVPLLLHVLLQVALFCIIAPQSHDALSTFKTNLQVLISFCSICTTAA